MVDIQSPTAEIRRGKKKKKKERRNRMKLYMVCPITQGYHKLECGPMPNVMVALLYIGGALCSTPQSLADAHY